MGTKKEYSFRSFFSMNLSEQAVLLYFFSPFLEESAALLRGAHRLMKSWRRQDKDEVLAIAHELERWAGFYRGRAFGHTSGGDLPSSSRFHDNERVPEDEGTSSVLLSVAREFIGRYREMLIMLPDGYGDDKYKWVDLLYEKLMNARYIQDTGDLVTQELFPLVGERALLLECELIASTQGRLEDSYRHKTKKTVKKKSHKTVEEMRAFAEECEIPFEWVKEVFETEHSTWWKVAEGFKKRADIVRSQITEILFDLPDDPKVTVWQAGSVSLGNVECWSQERLEQAENAAQSLISLLLSFRGNHDLALKRIAQITK